MDITRWGSFFLLAALSVGCSATTSSQNIRTAGLVALIDVTSEREGESSVTTSLVVGGANSNTHVVLDGGDHLMAQAGRGKAKEMAAVGGGDYEAKFDASSGEFQVLLGRKLDKPAHHNKGTLPPPFEITSKLGQKPLSRKHALTITWSPVESGADVTIHIAGECILDEDIEVGGDPGAYTVPGKTLSPWKSHEKEACNATVVVTRTTKGTTDPELDSDSRFLLHQARQATFVSGP